MPARGSRNRTALGHLPTETLPVRASKTTRVGVSAYNDGVSSEGLILFDEKFDKYYDGCAGG